MTLVVAVKLPETPLMVSVLVSAGAELLAVRVSTLLPEVGFVPHDAVTPVGSVEVTAKVTLPLNPPASVTLMVAVPLPPGVSETVLEEANIQKPGTCGPANASIRFWPLALPQPVTRSYPATALNHVGWFSVSLLP